MFTYDTMRQLIADHLARDADKSRALDTAIMAACRAAYEAGRQAGLEEAAATNGVLPLDSWTLSG